ncbi:hypothetical protein BDF19DRAFT_428291 [Syncephalis fuscata]|nr:hypothetical protein BDF19DRAFT_428291 [Syncephalis fuscata]
MGRTTHHGSDSITARRIIKRTTAFMSLNEPEESDEQADIAVQARSALDPLMDLYQRALLCQQRHQLANAVQFYEQAMNLLLMRQMNVDSDHSSSGTDSDSDTDSSDDSEEEDDEDEEEGSEQEHDHNEVAGVVDTSENNNNNSNIINGNEMNVDLSTATSPQSSHDLDPSSIKTSNIGNNTAMDMTTERDLNSLSPIASPVLNNEQDHTMKAMTPDGNDTNSTDIEGESETIVDTKQVKSPSPCPSQSSTSPKPKSLPRSRRCSTTSQKNTSKEEKISAATEQAIIMFIDGSEELRKSRDQLCFLILANFSRLLALPNVEWTNPPRALNYLSKAVQLDATNTAVWCQLANVARQCQQTALTLHAFEQGLLTKLSMKRGHPNPSPLPSIHSVNSDSIKYIYSTESTSKNWIEQITRFTPQTWECLLGLCEQLFEQGDIYSCQQLIGPILEVYPNIQIRPELKHYMHKLHQINTEKDKQLRDLNATWMVESSNLSKKLLDTDTDINTDTDIDTNIWSPMAHTLTRPTWAALGKAIGQMIEVTEPPEGNSDDDDDDDDEQHPLLLSGLSFTPLVPFYHRKLTINPKFPSTIRSPSMQIQTTAILSIEENSSNVNSSNNSQNHAMDTELQSPIHSKRDRSEVSADEDEEEEEEEEEEVNQVSIRSSKRVRNKLDQQEQEQLKRRQNMTVFVKQVERVVHTLGWSLITNDTRTMNEDEDNFSMDDQLGRHLTLCSSSLSNSDTLTFRLSSSQQIPSSFPLSTLPPTIDPLFGDRQLLLEHIQWLNTVNSGALDMGHWFIICLFSDNCPCSIPHKSLHQCRWPDELREIVAKFLLKIDITVYMSTLSSLSMDTAIDLHEQLSLILGIGEFLMDAALCNYTVVKAGGKRESKRKARDRWLARCRPWLNTLQKIIFSQTTATLKELDASIECRYNWLWAKYALLTGDQTATERYLDVCQRYLSPELSSIILVNCQSGNIISVETIRLAQEALKVEAVVLNTIECYQQGKYEQVIQRLAAIWIPIDEADKSDTAVVDEESRLLQDATEYIRTLPMDKRLELMSILYSACVAKMDQLRIYALAPVYLDQFVTDLQRNRQQTHSRYSTWSIIDKINTVLADLIDRFCKTEEKTEQIKNYTRQTQRLMPSILYLLKEAIILMYYRPDTKTSAWTSRLPTRNLFIVLIWTVFGRLSQQASLTLIDTTNLKEEEEEGEEEEEESNSTSDNEMTQVNNDSNDSGSNNDSNSSNNESDKEEQKDTKKQEKQPRQKQRPISFLRQLCNLLDCSGSKPLQNHHAHALPFDEQAASQVLTMLLPSIMERIRSNLQLRPESTDALESIFEIFPDPPFHIGGVAMTRDLVHTYLDKETEIDQAIGFTDPNRLFPLVQSYVTRHIPDVCRQLYYVSGKCMEISLGGRTKVKDNEDVEVMTEHFLNHVIMNPVDAEAWHCLGVAFHTHADNLMWSARDIRGKQLNIIQFQKKSFHCQLQAARMASLFRQGMDGIVRVKRATALAIWTELAFLIYAMMAKPLNGSALAPLSDRPTTHIQITSEPCLAEWQIKAYRVVVYCLNNALGINKKDWKLHYLLGKCLEKLNYKPDQIVTCYETAVRLCPERPLQHGQERSFDAHGKLLSYLAKQFQQDRITASIVERAIAVAIPVESFDELHEQQAQLVHQIKKRDNLKKLQVLARITSALMLLRAKDRRRWHHKPVYQLARLHYEAFDDVEAAINELQSLFYLKSATKSISNIWRTEFERPGSHFVYLQKYATFLIVLFERGGHLNQLIGLGRRLRKSTGVFLEPLMIFTRTAQACLEIVRHTSSLPAISTADSLLSTDTMTAAALRQLSEKITAAVQIGQTDELMARYANLQHLEQIYRLALGYVTDIIAELRTTLQMTIDPKHVSFDDFVEAALQLCRPLQSTAKSLEPLDS